VAAVVAVEGAAEARPISPLTGIALRKLFPPPRACIAGFGTFTMQPRPELVVEAAAGAVARVGLCRGITQ